MPKTLKGKMSLVYLCLVIITALIGYVSVINLYNINQTINNLVTNNYRSIHASSNMIEVIERQHTAVLHYLGGKKQKGASLFQENEEPAHQWYKIMCDNITESGEKELVENINLYYVAYTNQFTALRNLKNSSEDPVTFYNSKIVPVYTNLKSEIKKLSSMNEKAMIESKNHATKNSKKSMYTILVLSTVAVIGGFFISMFFTNKFLDPIYTLTQTVKLVKEGDLNQQANIPSKDEIGELAQEFNNMTKRLRQYELTTIEKLTAERNKSVLIVKNISEPLIVLDKSLRFNLVNSSFEDVFGTREGKILGRYFSEIVKNEELFECLSKIQNIAEEHYEKIIFIKLSEEDFYFNVILTKIKDINGLVTGFVIIFQNVTQFKQLEKIKTDFIATISHEFKTPLTSILMGTSLIMENNMGTLNERQKDIIETIHEDGQRLTTLVSDLLELTKIESGKSIFNFRECSLKNIIESSINPFYKRAEQKEIKLFFEPQEELPEIMADFEKITWVINNLISNALKYTEAGDEIRIDISSNSDSVCVSVKDTGIGIPTEYVEKIFDKYFQVKGYDLEVRGTGLGLAIVKEIIEAHGGRIWCESQPDHGSTFIFTLPYNLAA
ncbi:MAG: cell wall metabolism sensor histidine kinase WalK [Clostridia bacterium]|nr:cell wall metabolism sensor histidine kinase WalK [Clostridia bacterium]